MHTNHTNEININYSAAQYTRRLNNMQNTIKLIHLEIGFRPLECMFADFL